MWLSGLRPQSMRPRATRVVTVAQVRWVVVVSSDEVAVTKDAMLRRRAG
jgi:hypothetical protein